MIANARMYSIDPHSTRAWKALLEWVVAHASLSYDVIDYPAPLRLSELWARDDLGAVFMCGLPYSLRAHSALAIVAAPIPSPERYAGLPRYRTDIVVHADSAHNSIEDTFGGVAGYTARGVIDAIVDGRIDVGPLDSYCHDLLKQNQPEYARQVRTIASTDPMPIPVFVATRGDGAAAGNELARLRTAFDAAGTAAELATIRDTLALAGFAHPDPGEYAVLRSRHDALMASSEVW